MTKKQKESLCCKCGQPLELVVKNGLRCMCIACTKEHVQVKAHIHDIHIEIASIVNIEPTIANTCDLL